MSRKHYVRIAKVLNMTRKQNKQITASTVWFDNIVVELGQMFKADNSNFDMARFRKAIWTD